MRLCDYQILEYTISELQVHGVPFIIVVRLHDLSSYTLKSFILRQWKTKIGAASKNELDEVETFLRDLRLQSSEQPPTAGFFESLANLNVGPIRAFISGSCSEQDLNEEIQESFDKLRASLWWQEHFDNLI
jgi:hypothetical protein